MTFFGPEKPTPFSVLSERRVIDSLLTLDDDIKEASLDGYDENICHLMNKYLDIDCSDRILLIENGSNSEDELKFSSIVKTWPRNFERQFCLVYPVHFLELKTSNLKDLKYYEVKNCQEPQVIDAPIKYDKIIVKNCLKYFESNYSKLLKFILNLLNQQTNTENSLLVIQRVADLNTLPFYNRLKNEWYLNDAKYSPFIQELQKEYFSINWDIEVVKSFIETKSNWYKFLKNKQTYPLPKENSIINESTLDGHELIHGIRELDEGLFKYQVKDKPIELNDRLLFICAHQKPHEKNQIVMRRTQDFKERHKKLSIKKQNELLDEINELRMQLTPDLRPYMNEKKKNHFEFFSNNC